MKRFPFLSLLLFTAIPNCIAVPQAFSSSSQDGDHPQVSLSVGSASGTLRRYSHPGTLQSVVDTALSHDLDIWQLSSSYVDVYLPPHQRLPEKLQNIPHDISEIPLNPHLPAVSSKPGQWNLSTNDPANNTFHASYHSLYEIDLFIKELSTSFPKRARVIKLGHSAEGREITDDEKPGFVISGAQHAREWVATSTSLFLAHALLTSHELLLEKYDFYIIPSPNPDGYTYTWEIDRFWYKNRQLMGAHAKCIGLDMGRNWGYKWKSRAIDGGDNFNLSSSRKGPTAPVDPCSHWYPGHRAFESPEVNNVANFITTLPNLQVFLDLRAYGQMLSAPYSYSCDVYPRDAEDQMEAATGAVMCLIQFSHIFLPLIGQSNRAPGNIVDWMYKKAGIKYSFAVHLRDTGTYGFSLPAQWIRPVGQETLQMVEYFAKFATL
ncbi:hypothetical protein D9757_003025 [Collybiopsis confluens]|uniref:Inactive metallocarboxypeptidase ECM14 n=1 Tax=Collybiopsis confluens TaxID=2823264 RepID=A0A8H5MEQ7_9AGAR|nr:hypothetical protein D9757_003025 [Collybiopsis confluens]